MAISSRNYLVNNEHVYFSSNITKFSDAGFRYETVLIITDQAVYNYYRNQIKRRTPLSQIESMTISTKGSEFVIHIDRENDYRFHVQSLRNDIIEVLINLLCVVKGYFKEFKIYEVDLLNLNVVTTDRDRASRQIKIRPKDNFAQYWSPDTWMQKERESIDRRLQRRRNTQTLYVNPKQLKTNEICLEDFEILKVLGKGAFGKVVLAQKKDNGMYYAIKILKKDRIISENMFQKTLAEKTILQKLNHPFLVGLEYAFQTETKLYFVLEFMVGGELFNRMMKEGKFSEARAKFYTVCVILGIGFLHDQNYIYRDLKLENVLLDAKGYAVITDFGFAKFLAHDQKTKTFCGTPDYVAPEILRETGHDRMCDWWSLGVLVFEMMHGYTPFFNDNRSIMYENIKSRPVMFNPSILVSDQAKDLILKLLNKDPARRLGFLGDSREILAHPWFSDINAEAVLEKRLVTPYLPDAKNIEKNFDQEFLNEMVRESIEKNTPIDRNKLRSYEKDFELMNFNKDSVDSPFKRP